MRFAATLLALGLAGSASAQTPTISDNHDPAFGATGEVRIVASIPGPDPSGIVVIGGRMFLSFPKHDGDHAGPTLGEWKDGRLVPFPSAAMAGAVASDRPPGERLVSVHGITTDTQGRLWVIDDGKVKGQPIAPGGAKIVGFDPATGQIVAKILLADALLPGSHMNDLRVDLTHGRAGTAYVSDSSFDGHPALVVVDLATGAQRRVLADDKSIKADPGFMTMLDGRVLKADPQHPTFPGGGVDGLALNKDASRLYYAPLSSHRLYSLPTALLADPSKDDAQLASAVVDEGEKGAADGLASDAWGRLYTTASDHDAVFRRNLDGGFDLIARDPRFVWPDGIFADDRFVYVVLGQWTRLPRFHGGQDLRKPPFLIARMPISPPRPDATRPSPAPSPPSRGHAI
ncbi:L-dopachrome tautomerase-related protein [Sphingomonas abietis]|uniref:L-dopachrome tautomerase-related protein n=1 Tax=Sphingomonas abietis TaxID=3012344 RepID=A0ABY7NL14_9SPHN|nr:L-dopachrome tautomerase-related protein [Sphingomonas abietis]WBO21313.1 L-dopachrome tautomerase-related protein [Sphingomonas abietis]